jgi:hypothetical protein
LWGFLLAFGEIDDVQRGVDSEMIGNRHHIEGARARRKNTEFDAHAPVVSVLFW